MGFKKWFNRSVDLRVDNNINTNSNEIGVTMANNDNTVSVVESKIRPEEPKYTLDERIALAKSLGLDRQVKILRAEEHYERCISINDRMVES